MDNPSVEIYARVGGEGPIYALVEKFYQGVAADPLLRPLYPDDLSAASRRLAMFLIQRFGGPGEYSAERGHPRLRGRHMPFSIGPAEAEAWMGHMRAALQSVPEFVPVAADAERYFAESADFLINRAPHAPAQG